MSNDTDNIDCGIKENSVVQVNENGYPGWVGCIVQVGTSFPDGITGWIKTPHGGKVLAVLKWYEIDYIGDAVMGIDGKQLKEKK